MTDHSTTGLDVHDHIRELTQEHQHRELYVWQEADWNGHAFVDRGPKVPKTYWAKVPALVVQLQGAREILGSDAESGSRGAPTSKPATRLEAIDMLALIDRESAAWLTRLGVTAVPFETVRCLTRLHGLYPSAGAEERAGIERDVKRWWQQARIVTGWDMPAFKPRGVTCPVCGSKNTLRVKVTGAMCVDADCDALWEADQVGLLGEHIRQERSLADGGALEEPIGA